MVEFLQTYGVWIFFGLLFLVMLRGHRHGMGCGMGEHQHAPTKSEANNSDDRQSNRSSGCH